MRLRIASTGVEQKTLTPRKAGTKAKDSNTGVFAEGGRILDLTGDQSILTDAGMIAAQRLAPGTGLRTPAGFVECESAEALMGDYMVYDLQLATTPGNEARVVAGGLVANALQ